VSKRRWIRGLLGELFFHNFWLKAVSVFCALAFYGFIHSAQHAQRTLKVALVADMPPPESARFLVTKLPETIAVTVAGPRQQIESLRGADLDPVPLDLTQGLGVAKLTLTPQMVTGLAPAVRVLKVVPSWLTIKFEDEIPRKLVVRVQASGTPAAGMELKEAIALDPDHILATGPRSAIEVLQGVEVDPFDISGLGAGSHNRRLALVTPPSNVRYDVSSVAASLEIQPQLARVSFTAVTVEVVGLKHATVKPTKVDVYVEGPPKLARALKRDALIAYVDLNDDGEELAASGKQLFDVKLVLEGLHVEIKPKRVLVTW
jgi:YbbR domain-containing protein